MNERVSYMWLKDTVAKIEQGQITIEFSCKNAQLIKPFEKSEISCFVFYNALQLYGMQIQRKPGPRPKIQSDVITPIIVSLRSQGILVGVKKMYSILLRGYPQYATIISWHGIRDIYEKYHWLSHMPKRKHLPMRCRYQAVSSNEIWHVDIHNWTKNPGTYIYGVIDDRSRYAIGLSVLTSKDAKSTAKEMDKFIKKYGIPGAIWSGNGGENLGKPFKELLNQYHIRLINTHPNNSQQNGKIERLWPSLEKMTTPDPLSVDIFRNNYNNVIPHSALDGLTPKDVYYSSKHYSQGDPIEIDVLNGNQLIRKVI